MADLYLNQLRKIAKMYEDIGLPDVSYQDILPEMATSQGEYTPEMIQAQLLSEDPRLLQGQRDYLARLQGLSETGLGAEDLAAFAEASRRASSDAQSRAESAMQNARARGVAGGGLEFAMREMGNQAAADRQSMEGLGQAAEAARRRQLALTAYGQELGGQRQANLDAESRNKNIINQFNMMNAQERNRAQAANLAERQRLSDANLNLRNQAQIMNQQGRMGAAQQGFQNQLARTGGMAGAYQNIGEYYGAKQAADQKRAQGILGAIGGAAGLAFTEDPKNYGKNFGIGSSIGGGLGGLFQ